MSNTTVLTTHVIWLKTGNFSANGRTYSASANTSADINQVDAPLLQSQGVLMIVAPSSATNGRPALGNLDVPGQAGTYAIPTYVEHYDTSISQMIKCDPAGVWHRCDTGAVV